MYTCCNIAHLGYTLSYCCFTVKRNEKLEICCVPHAPSRRVAGAEIAGLS